MAIKYGWQNLQRRLYNWQNVSRVIINWSQVRPTSQQYVNYHIVSDWTNAWGGWWAGIAWVPSGWSNNGWVITSGWVSNWWTGSSVSQQYQWLPSLKNAYKIEIVYQFEWDQSTIPTPFDATLLRLNNREYQTQLVSGWDQILWLSNDSTASLSWLTAGTYTITTTLELNDLEATQVMNGPNSFESSVSAYTISTTERSNIRNCDKFIVYLNNGVTLSRVDFYIYNNAPVTHSDMQWPCPTGFHVPTMQERVWLKSIMDYESLPVWEMYEDVLFMPITGRRRYADWNYVSETYARYRTSIGFKVSSSLYAGCLGFTDSTVDAQLSEVISAGRPIRAFKDSFEVPTSSRYNVDDGIYRNQSEWLISITSDWTTGYTIMDKNLWATTVYHYWDTLSQANCGNLYQRWNNYGFPWNWTITTSSTKVDVSWYWPWNYYYSDTFIKWGTWQSSSNLNLRWGVSQWTWQGYD